MNTVAIVNINLLASSHCNILNSSSVGIYFKEIDNLELENLDNFEIDFNNLSRLCKFSVWSLKLCIKIKLLVTIYILKLVKV